MSKNWSAGDEVAGFVLLSQLGAGGYGDVWRAVDRQSGQHVALKLLKASDEDAHRRFARESKVLAQLEHPNIVPVVRSGEFDGVAFLATDVVPGLTLSEWLEQPNRTPQQCVEIAAQVAAALAAAHQRGVVHRDLKPENVIVDDSGVARVIDFGIAKIIGAVGNDVTKTGMVIGTAGYMSPEQLRGLTDIGPATDQYSLGVILFEMLEGRPLHTRGSALAVCLAHLTEPAPPINPSHGPRLATLVRRLLAKQPAKRYPSMAAVLDALGVAPPAQTRASSIGSEPVHSPKSAGGRNIVVVVVLCLVGLAGLGVFIANLFDQPQSDRVAAPIPRVQFEPNQPMEVVKSAADVSTDSKHSDSADETDPCVPVELPEGFGTITRRMDRQARPIAVYIPKLLRRDQPDLQAVVVFPSGGTSISKERFVSYSGMDRFAEEHGVVVIIPREKWTSDVIKPGPDAWDDRSVAEAWLDVHHVRERLCRTGGRVVLLAEGHGGHAVDLLVCHDSDQIAAAAVSGHRYFDRASNPLKQLVAVARAQEERPCQPPDPVPYLYIGHTKDKHVPWDGGFKCNKSDGDKSWSFARQEKRWRLWHGCSNDAKSRAYPDGSCRLWQCETPYVSCEVSGGRDWGPGQWREPDDRRCAGKNTEFPHSQVVQEFFEEHALAQSPNEVEP